ncbi:hypothetical protein [Polaromonas sp. JS666]|uniref:hypothetical protein n=1 Tax=Polaromonas sp. (strain JS666 / ATCC BAA-500) TaxID=296591 RepID=UPI000881C355|nr:hypothetical protein [Polaromonas sp. JS666]SDN34178.1 hypothetical protein SAMN05720382_104467 [Polaromonas sp. JS666]
MVHDLPEAPDSRSAAGSIRGKLGGLGATVLMFVVAGPALYGVAYYLVAGDFGRGEFRWSQLPSVVFWPLLMEFLFWVSLGSLDAVLQVSLPTVLAAVIFWLLNKRVMPSVNAMSPFRLVLSRSVAGLLVCVCAFVALNPATVTQGWDALYFYNPHIRASYDDSAWGFLEKYGQLFHLVVLGLAGALLGAAYGLSSWWFNQRRDN